jgi:TonB family protein
VILELIVIAAVRVSLVLALALLLVHLAPRASAATRHWVLTTAICGALAMPALTLLLPRWHAPIRRPAAVLSTSARSSDRVDVRTEFQLATREAVSRAAPSASAVSVVDPRWALSMLWIAGAAWMAIVLVAGLLRLRSIARASRLVTEGVWATRLARMGQRDPRLARVVLLQTPHPSLLMTWGLRRPRIVIPACALSWEETRVALVLEHEAEHIRRADWLAQLAAQGLCAVAWFNPLAWLVAARLRLESERACDDAVLQNGVEASEYAQHLVNMARVLASPRAWIPAPAMARTSSLERRVTAMLDSDLVRRPVSRFMRRVVVAVGLAATVSIASFAAQSEFATFSGTIRDQLGGTIANVTLSMTHATNGAKHEVKANTRGQFEFVGLVAGNYDLDVWQAGFKPVHQTLQLAAGQSLSRTMTIEVGTLQETVSVVDGPPAPRAPRPQSNSAATYPTAATCTADADGGRIIPPRKIADERVNYPASLSGSGRSGRVVLQATIGTDGAVREVRTVEADSPEFEAAASDAVRQWRFTQTLLNCVPIEVEMTVTTAFDPNGSAQMQMNRRSLGDAALPPPPPPPSGVR